MARYSYRQIISDLGFAQAIRLRPRRLLAIGFLLGAAIESVPATNQSQDGLPPIFKAVQQATPFPSSDRLRTASLLTWNIDRGERLPTISAELSARVPDVCLLQEVDLNAIRSGQKDVAGELARRLRLNFAYGVEFEELGQEQGKPAYIGQATLTHLPIRNSRILRFHRQSGWWQPRSWIPSSVPIFQRRIGSRIALVTELELDGKLLVVYNAHLESRSYGAIQAAQLDEMLADTRQYPPDTMLILAGDLNTKYLPSIFLHKLQRAGFQSATGTRIERTHAIAMALDWIFAKGPVRVENGQVRRDFKGSDHYPVLATLVPDNK